jgi:anti-sigma regulatory factor (Ser/Thr protein kinase)
LRLPAQEESLPIFRQLALDEATRAGLDPAAMQRVELVLEEALVNVIRHAYTPDAPEPLAELACGVDEGGVFRLRLTDWGAPFDPVASAGAGPGASFPGAEAGQPGEHDLHAQLESNLGADLEHRLPGGMGLFLILTMSHPAYARQGDANVLTLSFPPESGGSKA